jgi:hypothetical protein
MVVKAKSNWPAADKHSGLQVRQETVINTPQGKVNVIVYAGDYRKVDGVPYTFTTRIVQGADELRITFERIEHNVDIPEARFALPAALKRLLTRRSWKEPSRKRGTGLLTEQVPSPFLGPAHFPSSNFSSTRVYVRVPGYR